MKYLLLILIWASAAHAVAQDVPTPPAIPPGEDQIEHVEQGTRAPYEGMLLSIDTAIRWTNQLRWWPEAYRLQTQRFERIRLAEQESYQLRLNIVDESRTREVAGLREDLRLQADVYEKKIVKLENPPFWRTGWFGFVMGFVITGAAGAVGAIISVR